MEEHSPRQIIEALKEHGRIESANWPFPRLEGARVGRRIITSELKFKKSGMTWGFRVDDFEQHDPARTFLAYPVNSKIAEKLPGDPRHVVESYRKDLPGCLALLRVAQDFNFEHGGKAWRLSIGHPFVRGPFGAVALHSLFDHLLEEAGKENVVWIEWHPKGSWMDQRHFESLAEKAKSLGYELGRPLHGGKGILAIYNKAVEKRLMLELHEGEE